MALIWYYSSSKGNIDTLEGEKEIDLKKKIQSISLRVLQGKYKPFKPPIETEVEIINNKIQSLGVNINRSKTIQKGKLQQALESCIALWNNVTPINSIKQL